MGPIARSVSPAPSSASAWARLRHLYPLVFALWPALSLYATNIDHYRLEVLLRPVLASVTVAALLQGVLLVVVRRPAAAAFKAFCALLVFVVGGLVCRGWRGLTMASAPIEFSAVAAPVTVGLALLALAAKPPERFPRLPEVLWVFSLALLVMPLTTLIRVEVARGRTVAPRATPIDLGVARDSDPHIFYLVLDGYARADVLRDLYGYDNGPFLRALGERGCYVASAALANYPQTALSIASSLNMDYLDEWTAGLPPGDSDRSILSKAINENRVVAALRSTGYTFAAFATGYGPAEGRSAERFISLTTHRLFWHGFLGTTPLPDLLPGLSPSLSGEEQHRRAILNTFDKVGSLAAEVEPLFVLAHVVTPHPPFVFDANGAVPSTRRPSFSLSDGDAWRANARSGPEDYRRQYVEQLKFVNGKTLEAIDAIWEAARRPVVVVIQGDHGPGSEFDLGSAERTNLRERLAILSAYCFPDREYSDLYPGISPVNSFRVVLGRVRGRPIPLLPDRSYFVTWGQPYDYQLLRVDPDGELRVAGSPPPP